MEILEDAVPVRAGQLVQRLDCGAVVAGAGFAQAVNKAAVVGSRRGPTARDFAAPRHSVSV